MAPRTAFRPYRSCTRPSRLAGSFSRRIRTCGRSARYSGELAVERAIDKGRVRVSLFQENLADALISQNSTIPGTNTIGASVQNIDRIRSRGIELVADKSDVLIRGLDLSGSLTWVDSEILSRSRIQECRRRADRRDGQIHAQHPAG